MPTWKRYLLAQSIRDALLALNGSSEPARLIAGGTDLLLDLQQGRHPSVDTLVDVTAIPELTCLELRQDKLFIGAAVPLSMIASSPLVKDHAQAVVEACILIGGPQVRNTATLGGNVAHALPAADGTIALLALGAEAEVAGLNGTRRVPMLDLFQGPGKSTLHPHQELLVGFYLPLRSPGQASAFSRVMRPQGVALPILNMAAWVHRQEHVIVDLRLAVGPAGPTPRRVPAVEALLRGQKFTPKAQTDAIQALLENTQFRSSPQRASAGYRQHLSSVLLLEVLEKAWQRAAPNQLPGPVEV